MQIWQRPNPHIYEIGAHLFLREMALKYKRSVTLTTIPEEEWQLLGRLGFHMVWLMGVWQRSAEARREALRVPSLRHEYDRALPGWTEDDIAGSPYAVGAYRLDPALGSAGELGQLRNVLNRHGMGLIVDFVPNHLAVDHPWVSSHPEWFVQGSEANVRAHPDWFFSPRKNTYLAHGRDPNFAPWTDSVQANYFSPLLRQSMTDELLNIAKIADGVRCDLAMLALNDVFERVWGQLLKDHARPKSEFWADAIRQVRQKHPAFVFLAEAYWGLERKLQQIGFDFTYDKTLYDRLRFAGPNDIRNHLKEDAAAQKRTARFIENHDEPRAAAAFGRDRSFAAATIIATTPGSRLFHHGQLEGRRIKIPVQMLRGPLESPDAEATSFYERLLSTVSSPAFHEGEWQLLDTGPAWQGNDSHHNLLASFWQYGRQLKIVVVNYSASPAQARIKLPLVYRTLARVVLQDEINDVTYVRDIGELSTLGLYVALEPWRFHVLDYVEADSVKVQDR